MVPGEKYPEIEEVILTPKHVTAQMSQRMQHVLLMKGKTMTGQQSMLQMEGMGRLAGCFADTM